MTNNRIGQILIVLYFTEVGNFGVRRIVSSRRTARVGSRYVDIESVGNGIVTEVPLAHCRRFVSFPLNALSPCRDFQIERTNTRNVLQSSMGGFPPRSRAHVKNLVAR